MNSPAKGFYGRFAASLKKEELLMATALHPHYTMCLLSHFNPNEATMIKKRIADEMIEMVGAEVRQPVEKEEEVDQFHILLDTAEVTEVRQREEVEEIVKKTLKEWKRVVVSVPLSHDLFPTQYRDAWLDLFKKYNTPLPSSAAVERLFSAAGDILRSKRASLSNHNFERLVFLRGNMHLLKNKMLKEKKEEEENN